MKKLMLSTLLLVSLATVAYSDVQIQGETKVPVFEFVKLKAIGDIEGAGFTWKITDTSTNKKISSKSIWIKDGNLVFVAPPGVYLVELTAYRYEEKTKKISIEVAEVNITIGNPTPPTPPVIQRFDSQPTTIQKGKEATLTWLVAPHGVSVTLDGVLVETSGTRVVSPTTTTKYEILATSGTLVARGQCVVTVSDLPPPSPSPIPAPGFRVLIIYESSEVSKLPAAQQNILYAKSIRDYLRSKCVVDPENKNGAFRIYDKDVDTSGESKLWQDAMHRSRDSVPWILISTGTSGFEGPLPGTVDETLTLLKRFGG